MQFHLSIKRACIKCATSKSKTVVVKRYNYIYIIDKQDVLYQLNSKMKPITYLNMFLLGVFGLNLFLFLEDEIATDLELYVYTS